MVLSIVTVRIPSRSTSLASHSSLLDSITHSHPRGNSSGLTLPPLSSIHATKPFASASTAHTREHSPTSAEDLKKSSRSKKKKGSTVSPSHDGLDTNFSNTGALPGIFTLDTDLDHMEGIVDTNLATAAAGSGSFTPSGITFSMGGHNGSSSSSSNSNSVDSRTGLHYAEGNASSSSSHYPHHGSTFRSPESGEFDPRASLPSSSSSHGRNPPSPKGGLKSGALLPLNQPRRPSQLRHVNSQNEDDYNGSFDQIQPISAAGSLFSGSTTFSDPFSSSRSIAANGPAPSSFRGSWELDPGSAMPHGAARAEGALSPRTLTPAFVSSTAPPIAPAGAVQGAWVAPESWGVEGDQEDEDSLSSDDDEEGLGIMDILSASTASRKRSSKPMLTEADRVREDNLGDEQKLQARSMSVTGATTMRPMTSGSTRSGSGFGARPGTGSGRPGTGGRTGTSTSGNIALQVSLESSVLSRHGRR